MAEYSKDNRFPFHTKDNHVSICFDDNEDLYEFDFIFGKIVEKYPDLNAEDFYAGIQEISSLPDQQKVAQLKARSDTLLRKVKEFLQDETFIHQFHDRWGFGLDRIIQTLYAVYGYYFYTGKRTANVIKKTIDGYKRKPVH